MESKEQVDTFEKMYGQIDGLHQEIGALSKKSPSDAVNPFKLKMINKILLGANDILGSKYKPFDDFDQFEEDDVPTNSDVTMILSQYYECMEKMRSDNINQFGYWIINGTKTDFKTAPPKRITKR
jgi:hypothetical protein